MLIAPVWGRFLAPRSTGASKDRVELVLGSAVGERVETRSVGGPGSGPKKQYAGRGESS